jgi:SAM-dependent methyltransferase
LKNNELQIGAVVRQNIYQKNFSNQCVNIDFDVSMNLTRCLIHPKAGLSTPVLNCATNWNTRYQTTTDIPPPCQVLSDYVHLLPTTGTALDLACGLGANALLLAGYGLETYAWDYAETALERLKTFAQAQKLQIHTQVRDVVVSPPPPATFDVIVVCHFLDRSLVPALVHALKPNGLLFYQTFTRTCVSDWGPKKPEFRLADNELLQMFADLQIVVYREEGKIGDTAQGFRNEALLVARKVYH